MLLSEITPEVREQIQAIHCVEIECEQLVSVKTGDNGCWQWVIFHPTAQTVLNLREWHESRQRHPAFVIEHGVGEEEATVRPFGVYVSAFWLEADTAVVQVHN